MDKKPTLQFSFPFIFILGLALAERLINISFPFGDFDEGVYIATIRSFLSGYPLVTKTYLSQFPLFFYISTPLYIITHSIIALRLFPITCSVIIISLVYFILKKKIGEASAVIISVYLSLNSIFLLTSRTFQIDIPWTAMTFLAFFFLILFFETRGRKKDLYCMLSSLFFVSGILMKFNLIFTPVVCCFFLYLLIKKDQNILRYIFEYLFICIVVCILVIQPSMIHGLIVNAIGIRIKGIAQEPFWSGNRELLVIHELPMILLDLISIAILILKMKGKHLMQFIDENIMWCMLFIWLIITSIAISIYNPLFTHHLVFFILPSSLFAALAFQEIYDICKQRNFFFLLFCLCIIGIWLFSARYSISDKTILFPTLSSYDKELLTTASYIDTHSTSSSFVMSDDPLLLYLANRPTPPNLVDTSYVRIQTGLLTNATLITTTQAFHPQFIVFASGRFNLLPQAKAYIQKYYTPISIGNIVLFKLNED